MLPVEGELLCHPSATPYLGGICMTLRRQASDPFSHRSKNRRRGSSLLCCLNSESRLLHRSVEFECAITAPRGGTPPSSIARNPDQRWRRWDSNPRPPACKFDRGERGRTTWRARPDEWRSWRSLNVGERLGMFPKCSHSRIRAFPSNLIPISVELESGGRFRHCPRANKSDLAVTHDA
jgi:hypothetical protein